MQRYVPSNLMSHQNNDHTVKNLWTTKDAVKITCKLLSSSPLYVILTSTQGQKVTMSARTHGRGYPDT